MRRQLSIVATAALVGLGLPTVLAATAASVGAGPTVRVGDVQVVEGDAGTAVVKVPVDLSVSSGVTVSMKYRVAAADPSADATDAILKTGTLTFRSGVTNRAIGVTIVGDTDPEQDQHLAVTVSAPTGDATLADPDGSVDIVDDDGAGLNPATTVSFGSTSIEEANAGKHTAYVPITLSRPAITSVTVTYAIACSTASLVSDVSTRKLGSVTFSAGQRAKFVQTVIDADTHGEPDKALVRDITSATAGVAIAGDSSNVTIVDDDNATPPVNDGELTECGHGLPDFAPEPVPTSTYAVGTVGGLEQVSVASDGSLPHYPTDPQGNAGESGWGSASQDGSAVVFQSRADNLVAGDTNGKGDIFVRDRRAGTTERVSVKADGSQITAADMGALSAWPDIIVGTHPAISADGRFVVFETPAALVPEDTNTASGGLASLDAYVYDRQTHAVDLVSMDHHGNAAGGVIWFQPSISANGRYVTFTVEADQSSLLSTSKSDLYVFVRDRKWDTTIQLLDAPTFGDTVISADGTTVVTQDVDDPDHPKLLAIDLATGLTDRVDVRSDGTPADESSADLRLFGPSVSATGRHVGFGSDSSTLSAVPATPGSGSAYIRDRVTGSTRAVGLTVMSMWPASIDDGPLHFVSGGWPAMMDLTTSVPSILAGRAESPRALSGDGHWIVLRRSTGSSDEVFAQRLS